jgi:cob(I)alamin adenosyltransferase
VIQFIKGYPDIGEARFAQEFPERLTLKQFAIDLSRGIDERKVVQRRSEAEAAMLFAEEAMAGGDFDLIILDEINNALHYGLIDVSRLLTFIRTKPEHMEVILTGRSAPQEIIEAADYVTELRLVKHPYEQGVQARKGVDY